jgi:hypothetical protein
MNMSDDKKYIINKINNMNDKKCYKKIFELIIKHNINYTITDSGIFFNILDMDDKNLNIIKDILNHFD